MIVGSSMTHVFLTKVPQMGPGINAPKEEDQDLKGAWEHHVVLNMMQHWLPTRSLQVRTHIPSTVSKVCASLHSASM